MYVVFWLSASAVSNPSDYSKALTARFKQFDDEKKAKKFFDAMFIRALKNEEYQSRIPSNVTKSW
jgi:hypothetical protein